MHCADLWAQLETLFILERNDAMDNCLATGLGYAFGFGFVGTAGIALGTNLNGTCKLALVEVI